MSIEQRIKDLGLTLPTVPAPAANYANVVQTGNLLYFSGTVPMMPDGSIPKGKVGLDVTTEQAAQHARLVGLNLLAIAKQELGDLDRIRKIEVTRNGERGARLSRALEGDQRVFRPVRRNIRRAART